MEPTLPPGNHSEGRLLETLTLLTQPCLNSHGFLLKAQTTNPSWLLMSLRAKTHFLSTVIKGLTQSRLAFLSWIVAGLSSFVFRAQPSNQCPTHSSLPFELTRKLQAPCHEYSMTFFVCTLEGLCDMGIITLQVRKQSHRGQVDLAETTESRVGL